MKEFYKSFIKATVIFFLSINLANSEENIKIGLLIPLSGESSDIGKSVVKSVRMGVNKIDDKKILIIPRNTESSKKNIVETVTELYSEGIRIFIGPIFNDNLKGLSKFQDAIFLSLTNKTIGNPNNVISAGINAKSQLDVIKKYLESNKLEKPCFLYPKKILKKKLKKR